MIVALDLTTARDYISKYDTGEPKTVFKIGVIDSITRAKIEDDEFEFSVNRQDPSSGSGMRISRRQLNIQVVRYGLRGWENVKDLQGNVVLFQTATEQAPDGSSRRVAADASLNVLPPLLLAELATVITSSNMLSEQDSKNS